MRFRLGRTRRPLTAAEQSILAAITSDRRQRSRRWTARKLGFLAFWIFVAGSAYYVTFQVFVGFGLDFRLAALLGGIVFIGVVSFADRHEPR